MNTVEIIETERLQLIQPDLADFERFYDFWSEEEPDFPTFSPNALNREASWARLLRHIGHWISFDYGPMMVCQKHDPRIIGEVGVARFWRGISDLTDAEPEGLWRISHNHRGRGFAREAMSAIMQHADTEWQINRSFAVINQQNFVSQKIAHGLGYRDHSTAIYKNTPVYLMIRDTVTT